MKIEKADGKILLKSSSDIIYTIKQGDLICTLGKGENSYNMWHGSFKIKEKILEKRNCYAEHIECENGTAVIEGGGARFTLSAEDNRLRCEITAEEGLNRMWIKIPALGDEAVYGCGEIFTEFNLRGKKVNAWVAEHINALQTAKKLIKQVFGVKNTTRKQRFSSYETYYSEPTFLSSRKYYFHSLSTARCEFDFTNKDYHIVKTDSIAPFYIGTGDSFEAVLSDLTALTGRQPQLPKWAVEGAILGVQGGTEVMMKKYNDAVTAGTAVSGIWIQDWEGRRVTAVGKQLQWNWQWDSELYPELDEKIKELNQKGVKILGYINPFLAVEKPLYKEASAKGYCVKDKNGADYYVKITTFPAAMIDLTNPDACEWIKDIIKTNMIDLGFSGWMADFGEYLPTDCVLFSGEDPELVHNTWPARWARLNREAVEEKGRLGEIMFFTRAGHTDTKKYSTMMWNGDNHVDFSIDFGLPSVIPAALSLTCCGFGLSHSDIGGYTTFMNLQRSEELFMRWCEMNAFTPVLRGHEGLNPDVNAQFDYSEKTLKHHAKMSKIHLALSDYLTDCVEYNAKNGVGVIRPLFFYYDEPKAYNEAYEYLLGRDILVAPVLSSDTDKRQVYLPKDNWVHLWSGKEYGGGDVTVDAPIGEIPVFIRKNSAYYDSLTAIRKI